MVGVRNARLVYILCVFKKRAKNSISGSNLNSAFFGFFSKMQKMRKNALFCIF